MSSARAIVISALLLAPATALAQFGPDGFSTHLIVGGAPAFSFTAPAAGDYATLTAATGQTISCSRSSTATVQTSSSTVASVASGHCAVDYRGLQAEGASTNLFLQSGNLANAVWPAGATANAGTAPDGTNSLTRINGACQFQNGLFSTTATYTVSAWIQPDGANATGGVYHYCGSGGAVSICACSTSNGTACTADKTALSGAICKGYATVAGPTRLMLTASCSSVGTGVGDAVCSGPSYPGSSTILAWGAQLEQQVFATSYIPSTNTSVTRAADAVSLTKPSAITFTSKSYTASAQFALEGAISGQQALVGSDANFVPYLLGWSVSSSGVFSISDTAGASPASKSYSVVAGASHKAAVAASGTALAIYLDGTAGAAGTIGTQPSEPTVIDLGSQGSSTRPLFGWISAACLDSKSTGCKP